jgi:hypothetical protein
VPSQYSTIQAGIDASSDGDTVLVAAGTYVENINYNGKNIVVGSLYLTTQDTSYISSTIIDGNQAGSVVTFESGNEITSLLCGFTIRNGLSDWGGGVSCSGYSATLSNLIIEDNSGNNGGGIYCQANSAPIITDVIIRNNTSWHGGGFYHHSGVSWSTSTPVLTNVSIVNNSVTYYGGGVLVVNTNPIFTNVTISGNTSDSDVPGGHGGGGIYVWGSSEASLNSTFINTIVTNNSGNYGIYNRGSGAISILYSNLYNNEIGNCYNCGDYVGTNITVNANGDSCDAFYNIQENPYFVNPNSGDYHLSDYSPAIGAGTATGAPTTDIEGNPRPNPADSNPDMGAYENPLAFSSFDLVYPFPDTTIVLTRANFLDTLYFAWNQPASREGDELTYKRELTGDLPEYIRFIVTSDEETNTNMYKVPYHHIEDYMHTAGVELITGTWTIVANDGKYDVHAENGPFTLTIDASAVNVEELKVIPESFALHANYPNPFNPTTTILYDLPEAAMVHLVIYDVLGRQVRTLINQDLTAGYHKAVWDATDDLGRPLSGGLYIYRIQAGGFSKTMKMVLLK